MGVSIYLFTFASRAYVTVKCGKSQTIRNTNTYYDMKKTYLEPEVQVNLVVIENNFLASGENLAGRNYGSDPGEDTDGFWE